MTLLLLKTPQLTNRIYLKVKTFNKIIKALKGMTNGF
jgi:uncharacterized protein YoxC